MTEPVPVRRNWARRWVDRLILSRRRITAEDCLQELEKLRAENTRLRGLLRDAQLYLADRTAGNGELWDAIEEVLGEP